MLAFTSFPAKCFSCKHLDANLKPTGDSKSLQVGGVVRTSERGFSPDGARGVGGSKFKLQPVPSVQNHGNEGEI